MKFILTSSGILKLCQSLDNDHSTFRHSDTFPVTIISAQISNFGKSAITAFLNTSPYNKCFISQLQCVRQGGYSVQQRLITMCAGVTGYLILSSIMSDKGLKCRFQDTSEPQALILLVNAVESSYTL